MKNKTAKKKKIFQLSAQKILKVLTICRLLAAFD